MIINLKENTIYTDDGEFIKKLECPQDITEEDLENSESNPLIKHCVYCSKGIYKTENLTDAELKEMVARDPKVCFYIKSGQKNISHISAGMQLFFKDLHGASSFRCLDCGFQTGTIITNLRSQSNEPFQCQECGEIYETKENTCSHKNQFTDKNPIFCKACNSTNVIVIGLVIG